MEKSGTWIPKATDPIRILIQRPGALGDICRTLPALNCLRRQFPAARLTWLVYDSWQEILDGHPELDGLIVARRTGGGSQWEAGLVRELRNQRFEITLDFQGTFRSGLLALLSGCSNRIGFSRSFCREGNHLFNNRHVELPRRPLHRVEKNLALVRALEVDTREARPVLPDSREAEKSAEEWLRQLVPAGASVILMIPGASRRQSYKRWPPSHFSRLAILLREAGHCPLIAWGPGEERLAIQVEKGSGQAARMLPPSGIRQLAAVIRRSACMVTGDSGPMHLASALGVPLVALFGGTDPRLNAPWSRHYRLLDGSPHPAGRASRKRDASRFLASILPETVAYEVQGLLAEVSANAKTTPNGG